MFAIFSQSIHRLKWIIIFALKVAEEKETQKHSWELLSSFPNCKSVATLSGSEKARVAEELRLKGYVLQLLSSPSILGHVLKV